MRTCLTITLLLWASLASQAQATGLIQGQTGNTGAAICSGQAYHRTTWTASEQTPVFIPAYPQLAGPAFEPAPSVPAFVQDNPPQVTGRPCRPRAP